MKLISRKALIAAATTVALSTSALTAPAFADDDAVAPESSVSNLTDGSSDTDGSSVGSSSDPITYLDEKGESKTTTKLDYYSKKIGSWVKMLTTIASLFTAVYSISNAIQKLAPKA